MTAAARAFRPQRFSPLVLGLILVLLVIIVPPVLFLIQSSLRETNFDGSFGAVTSRYYRTLVENDRFFLLVANSALYAFGSALLALTLGGILQGLALYDVTNDFRSSVEYVKPFRWLRGISGILLLGAHVVFAVLFVRMLLQIGDFEGSTVSSKSAKTPREAVSI